MKLHEYRARYVNLCQSFSICEDEFKAIFCISSPCFVAWDLNNDGLIEALEVLSGLALFSSSVLEDRLQCTLYLVLFSLFDFNLENSISRNDLQLLVYSSLNSAYKILGILEDITTHEVIQSVLHQFPSNIRIDYSQFVLFCRGNEALLQAFKECELARDRVSKKYA